MTITINGGKLNQPTGDNADIRPFSDMTISSTAEEDVGIIIDVNDEAARGTINLPTGWTKVMVGPGNTTARYRWETHLTAGSVSTLLQNFTFTPRKNQLAVGQNETTFFLVQVSDDRSPLPVVSNDISVRTTSVNDAPVISGTSAAIQNISDTATIKPFTGVTLSDPDPGQTETLTVTLSDKTHGTLTSAVPGGSYNASTGVYTFSGLIGAVQNILQNLTFVPAVGVGAVGSSVNTTFVIRLSDSLLSATDNQTVVSVTATEHTLQISGETVNQAGNDKNVLAPFSAITVTDPDMEAHTVTLTIKNGRNTGDFTSMTGWGGGYSGNDIYYTRTFTAAEGAAGLQAALRAFLFAPKPNRVAVGSTETTQFELQITDGGSTRTANPISVQITSLNDAPAVNGTITTAVTDGGGSQLFAGLTLIDPDPGQTETLTVTLGNSAYGALSSAVPGGSYDAATGVYRFSGSIADAQSALQSLIFTPATGLAPVGSTASTAVTVQIADGYTSASKNENISITATNHPLQISGEATNQPTDDQHAVAPFSAITVSDSDIQDHTVAVTVKNGVNTGDFANGTGWSRSVSGNDIVYSRTFTAAGGISALQTALRSLNFAPNQNRAAVGSAETTQFELQISDGGNTVTAGPVSVQSTSVNDAPVLGGLAAGSAITDSQTASLFASATLVDPDPGQTETLVVTLSDKTHGTLSTALPGGSYDAGTGKYTFQGTAAAAQTLLRSLVFTPTGGMAAGTSGTTGFTIHVEDGVGGVADDSSINITVNAGAVVPPPTPPTPPVVDPTVTPPVNTPVTMDYSTAVSGVSLLLPERGATQNALGGSGNDILIGNSQNNLLNGGGGNNQLWGGGGNDTLVGGMGSNTFWVGRNDGHDLIRQAAANSHDALYLYNVDWTSYTAGRQGNDLQFDMPDGSSAVLENWYVMDVRDRVQGFIFQNGVVAAWNDGAGAEVNLYDPCYADNNIHMLQAFDTGPCTLRGGSGDDAIAGGVGNDNLWGNAGNDIMAGGAGVDTYWFGRGDGRDIIASDSRNSEDIVNLYNTTDPSAITTSFSGNDLILQMGNGETLTLKDWKLGGGYQMNRFQIGGGQWHLSGDGGSWVRG